MLTRQMRAHYCDHSGWEASAIELRAVSADGKPLNAWSRVMAESAIERLELIHVVLPPRREHKWTGATEPIGGYLLVKLFAEDGSCGWGECTALKDWAGEFGRYFGESVTIARAVIETYLAPAVKGAMPSNIVDIHARMDRAIKGYPYAKAAIDMAAYDLAGIQIGVPVHTLLGGAVRTTIPITHSIGLIPLDDAEREVVQVTGEGIRTIKIKVGVDADRDVAIVKRIRDAVGPSIDLCIDANQGYATPGEAIQTYRRLESCRIKYLRAAGARHGPHRAGRAGDRLSGHGRRNRLECARRHRDRREARGANRVDLHHEARRALSRHAGGSGVPRLRDRVQRQRLD